MGSQLSCAQVFLEFLHQLVGEPEEVHEETLLEVSEVFGFEGIAHDGPDQVEAVLEILRRHLLVEERNNAFTEVSPDRDELSVQGGEKPGERSLQQVLVLVAYRRAEEDLPHLLVDGLLVVPDHCDPRLGLLPQVG